MIFQSIFNDNRDILGFHVGWSKQKGFFGGYQKYKGGGAGLGMAGSATAEFGVSNAQSSEDLNGYSVEGGGSGGHLGDFGGTYAQSLKGSSKDTNFGDVGLLTITVGVGEGAEGHSYLIKTAANY